jgi:hypothetical protein
MQPLMVAVRPFDVGSGEVPEGQARAAPEVVQTSCRRFERDGGSNGHYKISRTQVPVDFRSAFHCVVPFEPNLVQLHPPIPPPNRIRAVRAGKGEARSPRWREFNARYKVCAACSALQWEAIDHLGRIAGRSSRRGQNMPHAAWFGLRGTSVDMSRSRSSRSQSASGQWPHSRLSQRRRWRTPRRLIGVRP